MLIGDYVHTGTTTNHLLIRASADQYNGTKIGDKLYLDYLGFTSDYNQDRNNYQKDPKGPFGENINVSTCLLYTSPSPRDRYGSRMPSSA